MGLGFGGSGLPPVLTVEELAELMRIDRKNHFPADGRCPRSAEALGLKDPGSLPCASLAPQNEKGHPRRCPIIPAGIENDSGRSACTISRRGGTIGHEGGTGSGSSRASKCAEGGGVETESSRAAGPGHELRHVVEPALARALVLAAEAQRWDVVVQIATELKARREPRDGVRGAGDCMSTSATATGTTGA
jgi:hypothetical protein